MSKNTKHTEKVTENKSFASEIIADQAAKTKKMEIAIVALSVALLASTIKRRSD